MKWKIFSAAMLALVIVSAFVAPVALAADPPAYHFGLVQCSGLSLAELSVANQKFDTRYGFEHQLTTPAQWVGSYPARVEEFASTLGCPLVFRDGQLTLHYKAFGFWYRFYLVAE